MDMTSWHCNLATIWWIAVLDLRKSSDLMHAWLHLRWSCGLTYISHSLMLRYLSMLKPTEKLCSNVLSMSEDCHTIRTPLTKTKTCTYVTTYTYTHGKISTQLSDGQQHQWAAVSLVAVPESPGDTLPTQIFPDSYLVMQKLGLTLEYHVKPLIRGLTESSEINHIIQCQSLSRRVQFILSTLNRPIFSSGFTIMLQGYICPTSLDTPVWQTHVYMYPMSPRAPALISDAPVGDTLDSVS